MNLVSIILLACLVNSESAAEIRTKTEKAIEQKLARLGHKGVAYCLYRHRRKWQFNLSPREALADSTDSCRKSVSRVVGRTSSGIVIPSTTHTGGGTGINRSRRSLKNDSSTELDSLLPTPSKPKMGSLLGTIAFLMAFGVAHGGLFGNHEIPEEDQFNVGMDLTERACRGGASEDCPAGGEQFWLPRQVEAGDNTTEPEPAPIQEDPCYEGKCFNWAEYRRQVVYPFIQQLQQAQAIGRFDDDELEGSMFSSSNFKSWYEAQRDPPDHQTISSETAAILSLKFLAACLAQTRIARVEASYRDGLTWQTIISVPGCLLVAIYLAVSICQLKSAWKVRCEKNEDLQQRRTIERLLKPTAPPPPQPSDSNQWELARVGTRQCALGQIERIG